MDDFAWRKSAKIHEEKETGKERRAVDTGKQLAREVLEKMTGRRMLKEILAKTEEWRGKKEEERRTNVLEKLMQSKKEISKVGDAESLYKIAIHSQPQAESKKDY